MMSEMNEKCFMSQAPWTAEGEVPRELNVLGVDNQHVAELPLAVLDPHILDGLQFEAVPLVLGHVEGRAGVAIGSLE